MDLSILFNKKSYNITNKKLKGGKMKIAIIIPGGLPVPPIKGGAVENLIYTLIKENDYQTNPCEIDLYGIKDEFKINEKYTKYYLFNKDLKIYNISVLKKIYKKIKVKFNYSYFLNQAIKQLKNREYDYIIIENRPNYVMKVKKNTESKILLHMHNEHLTSGPKYQEVINSCDKIIVVSQYIKETLLKRYKVDTEKIKVLHNGIDTNKFNVSSEEEKMIVRQKYGILKDDFLILFSGRLTKEKGILQLIDAVIKCKEITNIQLLVVGASWFSKGSEDEFTKQLKERAQMVSNKVKFTGYIDYDSVANIYASADIAVLPSIWNDPFPLTVLECMSVGLPIISTISGGIPEMVNDKCGILLPIDKNIEENLAKSIMELYYNKSKRNIMALNSTEIVKHKYNEKFFYREFIRILSED